MSFLAPTFLGALALVGVPLLIHLIRRRKLKVVRWAAMEFLRQSVRRQRRRTRIEELILLLVRMLIVACAVLAFARPVLRALGVPLLARNARVYAVIVLDTSLSMGYRSNSASGRDGVSAQTSFDRAKQAAVDVVTRILRPGDSVSVVLMSDRPTPVIGPPSYDLRRALQVIRAAHITDRGTDFLAGAQAVDRLLRASKALSKEVYWISDDQATAWAGSKRDAARAVWEEIGQRARVAWISAGPPADARENLAVGAPSLSRTLVTPYLPARVQSRITNYGARSRQGVTVELVVDGRRVAATRLTIPAGRYRDTDFPPYLFVQPGMHTGRVQIADPQRADGLSRDNAAPFVVRTQPHVRTLVLDLHPSAEPARSESFFLLTAMAPGGAPGSLVPTVRAGGLNGVDLRGYDAVVIANASALSDADVRALVEFVRSGGGLLLLPGPGTAPGAINRLASSLLPARLGPRRSLQSEDAASLNAATAQGEALTAFRDTGSTNLGSARFRVYYTLDPVTDPTDPSAVQPLLRFSTGDPAFVERRIGLGRVILAAAGAGTQWSDLPLKSAFVPLVHQILSYLGQGPSARFNLRQDEPIFQALPLADAHKTVQITAPDGHVTTVSPTLDSRGVTYLVRNTSQSGVYRTAVDGRTVGAFAVALPATESDLRFADPIASASAAGLPPNKLTVARTPAELAATIRRSRYGVEVWRPFIYALLPLLLLESVLAQVFGRRG